MYDMMVLAFQTDSTRVATFLLANEGSNRAFPEIGIPEGHHSCRTTGNQKDMIEKVAQIDLLLHAAVRPVPREARSRPRTSTATRCCTTR